MSQVEQTNKKWKAIIMAGWGFVLLGCIGFIVALYLNNVDPSQIGFIPSTTMLRVIGGISALFVAGGIVAYFVGRAGAYWNHG